VEILDLRYIMPLANDLPKLKPGGGVDFGFLTEAPLIGPALDVVYNRDWMGRPIVSDVEKEGLTPYAKHFIRRSLPVPGFMTDGIRRVTRAAHGKTGESAMRAIFGVFGGWTARDAFVDRDEVFDTLKNMAVQNKEVRQVLKDLMEGTDIADPRVSRKGLAADVSEEAKFTNMIHLFNTLYRRAFQPAITAEGVITGVRNQYIKRKRTEAPPKLLEDGLSRFIRSLPLPVDSEEEPAPTLPPLTTPQ
jgi:hypothetical protein